MRIYFDTEFCDLWDPTPISFGFAAENGEEFYVEIMHDHERRSAFVERVVAPLLKDDEYHPDIAADDILAWLARFPDAELVCDFIGDYWILREMLGRRHPPNIRPRCARHSHTQPIFLTHPELRQHNALDDARALRYLNPPLQAE